MDRSVLMRASGSSPPIEASVDSRHLDWLRSNMDCLLYLLTYIPEFGVEVCIEEHVCWLHAITKREQVKD
eukprot:1153702-Pelagomonas_calceolata.AAC.8